jgi:deoxyhypusine synthase
MFSSAKQIERIGEMGMDNEKTDKTESELREIFESLNEGEKFGIAFAMFPARLPDLTHNDVVALMKLREKMGPRTTFD